MSHLLAVSFLQLLGKTISGIAILFASFSIIPSLRVHCLRLSAILFIVAISLFSNAFWTYFTALFIIATSVTEIEFLQNLAAIISGDKNYFEYKKAVAGEINSTQINKDPGLRSPMEYKILNTLWTKQINKFEGLSSTLFTFKISPNTAEFNEFRLAGAKLIGEGLISETPNDGNYHITPMGFDYCKKHYKEFGVDQWWPEETIDQEKLKKVLEK